MTDVRTTLSEIRETADAFQDVAENLHAMVSENRPPVRNFSQSGLYQMTLLIEETRVLVDSLNRLVVQMERDPSGFLFGDNQRGFEAK